MITAFEQNNDESNKNDCIDYIKLKMNKQDVIYLIAKKNKLYIVDVNKNILYFIFNYLL